MILCLEHIVRLHIDLNYFFQIYHIYSPKAVQIGDENLVQEVNSKTAEDENAVETETDTEVKGESEVVPNNNEKEQTKGKESGSNEEDRYTRVAT